MKLDFSAIKSETQTFRLSVKSNIIRLETLVWWCNFKQSNDKRVESAFCTMPVVYGASTERSFLAKNKMPKNQWNSWKHALRKRLRGSVKPKVFNCLTRTRVMVFDKWPEARCCNVALTAVIKSWRMVAMSASMHSLATSLLSVFKRTGIDQHLECIKQYNVALFSLQANMSSYILHVL